MIPLRFSSPPEKPALQIIATAMAVNRKTQVENANRRINLRGRQRGFSLAKLFHFAAEFRVDPIAEQDKDEPVVAVVWFVPAFPPRNARHSKRCPGNPEPVGGFCSVTEASHPFGRDKTTWAARPHPSVIWGRDPIGTMLC
jgi:hypothetical protein